MVRRRQVTANPLASQLSDIFTPQEHQLLTATGVSFLEQIGIDVVRDIVLNILSGRNLRDTTELLTRRRITALNLALLTGLARKSASADDFMARLPAVAEGVLANGGVSKSVRWIAQWMLGLTDKGVQNILRDDPTQRTAYRDSYIATCQDIITDYEREHGKLTGTLKFGDGIETHIDWLFFAYLLNAVGSQTLTIRGSGKSAYGKLFEKLVLGSLLYVLGFTYQPSMTAAKGVFWLSSAAKDQRESDATLIYELGKGVRFDIGFIGRSNPEIMLDKVARYRRAEEISGKPYYMATIIMVDRIPNKGQLLTRAQEMDGDIVQMSASYSPQQVARVLNSRFGFEHELVEMDQLDIEDYLRAKLLSAPLEDFIKNLPIESIVKAETSDDEEL